MQSIENERPNSVLRDLLYWIHQLRDVLGAEHQCGEPTLVVSARERLFTSHANERLEAGERALYADRELSARVAAITALEEDLVELRKAFQSQPRGSLLIEAARLFLDSVEASDLILRARQCTRIAEPVPN